MSEISTNLPFIGPSTEAYSGFEKYDLPNIEDALVAFRETGEAVVLWVEDVRSDFEGKRGFYLTDDELNRQMYTIMDMCGVKKGFHSDIKILQPNTDGGAPAIIPNETTFAGHAPSPLQIMHWLANRDIWADYPNDFRLGFALESPDGLLVFKMESEQIAVHCGECIDRQAVDVDFHLEDDHSCEHCNDDYEWQYQASLVPREKRDSIAWHINKYHPTP